MRNPPFARFLRGFLLVAGAVAMLLGGVAAAQQPESPGSFSRRMQQRLDRVEAEARSLQRRLDPSKASEDGRRASRGYDRYGAIRQSLKSLQEQCDDFSRRLQHDDSPMLPTANDLYRYQRQVEYRVRGMERYLRDIKRTVKSIDDDEEKAAAAAAESAKAADEELDRQESDEEWAEEWATAD